MFVLTDTNIAMVRIHRVRLMLIAEIEIRAA